MRTIVRFATHMLVLSTVVATLASHAARADELVWYKHLGQGDGAARWAGPKTVGSGWAGFKHVAATSGGVVYAINAAAELLWYRHDGRVDGAASWGAGAGNRVGGGWGAQHLLASDGAVLYTIAADGTLRWFKHAGVGSGTFQWAAGTGSTVGTGWGGFKHVVAAPGGVFYAVNAQDQLLWFKHTGRDNGAASWAPGTGNVVGTGWGGFKHLFAAAGGVLYAIDGAGELRWYKHTGRDNGAASWAPNTGRMVGTGWGDAQRAFAGDDGVIYLVKRAGGAAPTLAAPTSAPGLSDSMAQLQRDPESVFMPYYLSRPEVKGPIDGALSKLRQAEGKLEEVIEKLKALASNEGGVLGEWKTKRLCSARSVSVKGSCKAYAQECARFALPHCSTRCAKTVWPGICVSIEKINCTSPCEAWRSTSVCVAWWPDSVRAEEICEDVRYFDPTEGSVWKSARQEAEKALEAARQELERRKNEAMQKGRAALDSATKGAKELAGAAWSTVSQTATDLFSKATAGARALLEKIFELAGTTTVELLEPLFAKSAQEVAARGAAPMSRHATWLDRFVHSRRHAVAACEEERVSKLESPVRQLRTYITQSASRALSAVKQVLGVHGNWTKLMEVAETERWRFVAYKPGKIAKGINKGANWVGKLLRLEQLLRFIELAKKDVKLWAGKTKDELARGIASALAVSEKNAARLAEWIDDGVRGAGRAFAKWLDRAAEALEVASKAASKAVSRGAAKLGSAAEDAALEALALALRRARREAPMQLQPWLEYAERSLRPAWERYKQEAAKVRASAPKAADDAGKVAFKAKLAAGWSKLKVLAEPVLARMGSVMGAAASATASGAKRAAGLIKTAAKKIGLGPIMVALQWIAVGAAYPYAHYECIKTPGVERDTYMHCYVEKFTEFTRQSMFDALVGTAIELLDKPLVMPLAIGMTAAVSAAVAVAFTPATAATSGALMGMATRLGVTILLTVFADRLFPWYTQNIWAPNQDYFTERGEEGARLYWENR